MDNSNQSSAKMAVCNFKVKTVSNRELLLWYREKISPNLMSLNELGNGVDFCLGVDMLFPGVIGKRIIEVTDTGEYFRRLNLRRLQAAFSKLNVKAVIPINGLIKGSFKDLFTFGCWFKAFFEANCKSQPGDLNKVRSSQLNKWVKMKKQYESQKARLYAKGVMRSNSNENHTQLRNEDDCDSIDNSSDNNAVSNTDLTDVACGVQSYAGAPTELVSVVDTEQMLWTKNVSPGKTCDIGTETSKGDIQNDTSQTNICNTVENTVNNPPDTDCNKDVDILRTESSENTDCLTNPVTDNTSDTNPARLCLESPAVDEMLPVAGYSEQINIELENNNINLKEGVEHLLMEYNGLCNAMKEVKRMVNEVQMDPLTIEPAEDEVAAMKTCCNYITKVLHCVEV